ncbi:MAG: hypothetical protein FWD53_10855 [Phycisphaerales bacterium]|nr:hypothetical protein [Phycisphaerales bacterium]
MSYTDVLSKIKDDEIRTALRNAIEITLFPALTNHSYKGQFAVVCDGSHFGKENSYPGLDAWEITNAYLLLGKTQEVRLHFDYVQASQRADGNIPFAIFSADRFKDRPPSGGLIGMKYPDDIFEYAQPELGYPTRQWIGLFEHWVPMNPLGVLAVVSYILMASALYGQTKDGDWLKRKLPSLERAARYLLAQKCDNGLISGAGFYLEKPPRYKWDGVTQCYAYEAFNLMSGFYAKGGVSEDQSEFWHKEATKIKLAFNRHYWTGNRYAEYIHPEHGTVDWHGMTDVNWAAIAFELADAGLIETLKKTLLAEKDFWWGDMPTQTITRPYTYRDWELYKLPDWAKTRSPLYDAAAMGRVWYLEIMACLALGEYERIRESVLLVSRMGNQHDGKWFERYHMIPTRQVVPSGPKGYCEYAAILTWAVLTNMELFT